tara:strand:- start:265 stop:636 length:372 start_codon:yes stop_codon:yes gene_type:complete
MSAVIIDDGTMDTVVEYDGMRKRYSTTYRSLFDSEEEFLDAAFKDFYDDQTDQLEAAYDSLPRDITLCYNDDCRGWKTANPDLEGYATVKCLLGCKDYKVLYKELPKITDAMWNRLQLEASDS